MAETTHETSSLRDAESGTKALRKSLSFANLQQNAQYVGFLVKYEKGLWKRIFGRSWQRKYCLLSGYHFYWFKNKKGFACEKSNGVINLRYFDRCTIPTDKRHTNLPHAFQLASSQTNADHHSFLFQADSVEEQQRWMKEIQLVIFQCQTQGRAGTGLSVGARASSRTASPVLHRSADDERRPRSSSIPEAGCTGTYRSRSVGPEDQQTEEADASFPVIASVSRSESRNTKPDLIPRMTTYNQVVNELQSRLNSRCDDPHDHDQDQLAVRQRRLSSQTSPANSPRDAISPTLPDIATSGSSSLSSYENTENERISSPHKMSSPPTAAPQMNSQNAISIEARFDSVLKMMEDLTDEENGLIKVSGGPEYALPFKSNEQGNLHGPAVPPKPKREMYESLLQNHVGPYLVSPIVNVSG